MARQDARPLRLHRVPYVAVKVIIASEQQSPALAESHAGYSTDDVVVRVQRQFLVGPDVEKSARCVVRARGEGVAAGEEGDGVDVRLVTGEGLLANALANVPQLGRGVAGGRYKAAHVGRQRQRHDIPRVTCEGRALLPRLNVPQCARHVSRARHDLAVVNEAAAGQVASVARQLARHAYVALARLQAVDAADVVQPSAGDVSAGRGIGAGHDPGGAQRDGVHLVSGVRVPHDELAVL